MKEEKRKVLNMKAPLLNDVIFKRTFTKEGTEPILRDFLEAILEKKITKVEVKNNEIPKERIDEKGSTLDIRAEIDGKQIVDIEMQVEDEKNLSQRGPIYACKNIATQLDKGNNYKKLKASIGIWILNFNYYKVNSYHSVAKMMFDKESGKYVDMGYTEVEEDKVATDMLEMHYIEMPKFLKKNPGVEDKLDQWLWLISGKGEKIKMAEKKNRNVKEALEKVDEIMQDKEIIDLYFDQAVAKWDREHTKHYIAEKARNEGIEKGLAEGRKEGIQEGRQEGLEQGLEQGRKDTQIKVAKVLLKNNQDIELIIEATGLSKEEIKKINRDVLQS